MLARTAFVAASLAAAHCACGQSAFTYQGRLTDNGMPAEGLYDLRFTLYDAEVGGAAQGGVQTISGVPVEEGLFTAAPDFGLGAFTGSARWLEVQVRPAGGVNYSVLSPRQPVTAAPHALVARKVTLPLNGTGTTTMGIFAPTGLIDVTQHGTAAAVLGTSTGAGPAVYGNSTGAGPAVVARNTGGGPALQLSGGPVRVVNAGVNTGTPLFIHEVTQANLTGCFLGECHGSVIDHPYCNGDPNAMLIVTVNGTPSRVPPPVMVMYEPGSGRWWLWTNGNAGSLLAADRFNVLVVKR